MCWRWCLRWVGWWVEPFLRTGLRTVLRRSSQDSCMFVKCVSKSSWKLSLETTGDFIDVFRVY